MKTYLSVCNRKCFTQIITDWIIIRASVNIFQIRGDGSAVSEREWRRQNLEWERRRREADLEGDKSHRRVVDERRDRMVLRQQQREKDYKLKKQTDLANKNSQDLTRAVKVRYYAYLTFSLYDICNLILIWII